MAIENEQSTQVANATSTPPVMNDTYEDGGRLRAKRFNHTQSVAGDAGSTVDMVKIPPGKWMVHLDMSRIAFSAFGASRVLDVGHTGYTKPDGTAVAAAAAAFVNDLDVSSAGNAKLTGVVGGDETFVINSKNGTTIQAQVAGGTIPLNATLDGVVYVSSD